MQIEIDERDMERIKEICVEAAVQHAGEAIDREVRKAVGVAVSERIAAIADGAIREVVESIMAKGFPKTDNYGSVCGTITLRERVTEAMFPKNGYSDTPINRIFRECLERELKGELADLMRQAKGKIVDLLEGDILNKLRGYLRDGMALKK